MSHVCQWGLYNWFEDHGVDLVHSDDIDALKALMPQARLFHCVEENGGYLILQYGEAAFRVKPELFTPVSPPRYRMGQQVRIRSGDGYAIATICDIMWHFKKRKPYYFLSVAGKRSGRQYWDEEIDDT